MNWRWYLFIFFILLCVAFYFFNRCSGSKEVSEVRAEEAVIRQELEKADLAHVAEEERLYRLLAEKEKRIIVLDGRNAELEAQKKNIVVPDTPSGLVDGFRKHGFLSARRNLIRPK